MQTLSPASVAPASSTFTFREPGVSDGNAIHQLVGLCPPLDLNSGYAYLLLCVHHAQSCVIAEHPQGIAGFVSAYRLPAKPDVVFIWQVAVAPHARGQGLALQMLKHLLKRPALTGWRWVETTVTPSNLASKRVFESLAADLSAGCEERMFFSKEDFHDQRHEPEVLMRIGPCVA